MSKRAVIAVGSSHLDIIIGQLKGEGIIHIQEMASHATGEAFACGKIKNYEMARMQLASWLDDALANHRDIRMVYVVLPCTLYAKDVRLIKQKIKGQVHPAQRLGIIKRATRTRYGQKKYKTADIMLRRFFCDNEVFKNPNHQACRELSFEFICSGIDNRVLLHWAEMLQELGYFVEEFLMDTVPMAHMLLTDVEKEKGSMVVDIGAHRSNLIIFHDYLVGMSAIPYGSAQITRFLSDMLHTDAMQAEHIKKMYGHLLAVTDAADPNLAVKYKCLNGREELVAQSRLIHLLQQAMMKLIHTIKASILHTINYNYLVETIHWLKVNDQFQDRRSIWKNLELHRSNFAKLSLAERVALNMHKTYLNDPVLGGLLNQSAIRQAGTPQEKTYRGSLVVTGGGSLMEGLDNLLLHALNHHDCFDLQLSLPDDFQEFVTTSESKKPVMRSSLPSVAGLCHLFSETFNLNTEETYLESLLFKNKKANIVIL